MNHTKHVPDRHPAEERLLDVALAEVMRTEITSPSHAFERAPIRRPSLAAAALFLLGLSATAGILVLGRIEPSTSAPPSNVQDAKTAPMAPAVSAKGRKELDALPADTQNLTLWPHSMSDLKGVTRLRSLRRLQIAVPSRGAGGKLAALLVNWEQLPDDLFAPLAELKALEVFSPPRQLPLRAAHLTPLRQCPNLRRLELGEQAALADDLIEALGALPKLRALFFYQVTLDAATVRRLAALPLEEFEVDTCPSFDAAALGALTKITTLRRLSLLNVETLEASAVRQLAALPLEGLQIDRCHGLNAAAFAAVCDIPTLRRLTLGSLGRPEPERSKPYWRATPSDFKKLEKLETLEELVLQRCAFGVEELRNLPTTISSLKLWGHDLANADFLELRRLGSLRRLELTTYAHSPTIAGLFQSEATSASGSDALAEALASLRLQSLRLTGALTDTLVQQLATQPDIAHLHLTLKTLPAIDALTTMPRLADLSLMIIGVPAGVELDDLRPLATCKTLRRLELSLPNTTIKRAQLAEVFGKDVELVLHSVEFKIK